LGRISWIFYWSFQHLPLFRMGDWWWECRRLDKIFRSLSYLCWLRWFHRFYSNASLSGKDCSCLSLMDYIY